MEKSLVFGLKQGELLANYNRQSSSWKMSQLSLLGDCQQSLEIFPNSGMIRNGELYLLEKPVPFISEKECLSLPTPRASDWKGARIQKSQESSGRGERNSLMDYFRANGNWAYPPKEIVEYMMGFPEGWTD